MASRTLFHSVRGAYVPPTDAINSERAPAYGFGPRHAVAQFAATGCLTRTFYATEHQQLDMALKVAAQVEPEFIAKAALYGRTSGHMKDAPALLCALLSVRSPGLMAEIFDRVIDTPRMLRNFVQIMRSGAVGRKSLGTLPRRMVRNYLERHSDEQLFRGCVGADPSLADIIKMVHPKPRTASRQALFGYLIGQPYDAQALPLLVRQFEEFKAGAAQAPPDVPFQMLTALPLNTAQWSEIARNAPWQMTRMNLNTFARHAVFNDASLVPVIADRLRNAELIRKARALPYQLLAAYTHADRAIPAQLCEALQDAVEIAVDNVPEIAGDVAVFPDVSGSMRSAITGTVRGATSAVRCVDVAALVAAAIVRKNRQAVVMPFDVDVVPLAINPRDSVFTNAQKLAAVGGGGTNCSAGLQWLNAHQAHVDLVIFISDNQSWIDTNPLLPGTETLRQWNAVAARCPNARMACIDLVPNATTQAPERPDIMNIGGFSDAVFDVLAQFQKGALSVDHWVGIIEQQRI